MDIKIREEKERDFIRIRELNRLAFRQENESKLIERIREGDNFVPELSLVAEFGGEIVGHILFSRIKIVGQSVVESLALAPMAVDPQFQKRGTGGKLIEAGLEKAKALGFGSVVVIGHKEYYPKFGFQRASKWGISCPFDVPAEACMAIELIPGALGNNPGTVKYPDEFME